MSDRQYGHQFDAAPQALAAESKAGCPGVFAPPGHRGHLKPTSAGRQQRVRVAVLRKRA